MADLLSFITGVALLCFLMILLLDRVDKSHKFLRLFMFPVIFFLLLFIPKALLDDTDFCEVAVANATVSGATTLYEYERVCFTNEDETYTLLYTTSMTIVVLIASYFLVYVIWYVLNKIREWLKSRGWSK